MENERQAIKRFYRSDRWNIVRAIKIAAACGLCEKCSKPGNEVHHKIHLTPQNINNPNIAINQDNLILLCNECHNKEHHRFGKFTEYLFDNEGNLVHSNNKKISKSLDIYIYGKIKIEYLYIGGYYEENL